MVKVLAVFVTIVAALMTAVAAWDRGGTVLDKGLLVAMSVVIVLSVHLLPSLSRRPAAWLVWAGCLLCAVYGHLTFFTHASLRAGDALAQQSTLTVGTQKQFEIVRESLNQVKARPVAEVAAELAQTSDKRVRASLNIELTEARKAETLRDELVRLAAQETHAKVEGAVDPVSAKLAAVFEVHEGAIQIAIGLTFALLVELIGAILWVEALRPSHSKVSVVSDATQSTTAPVTRATSVTTPAATTSQKSAKSNATLTATTLDSNDTTTATQDVTTRNSNEQSNATQVTTFQESNGNTEYVTSPISNSGDDLISTLKSAIENGKCKATVNSIRHFLGCSQNRAVELRRLVTS